MNTNKKDTVTILNWLIGLCWPVDKDDFENLQKQAKQVKEKIEEEK